MIARARPVRRPSASACCAKFLTLLPAIRDQARFACRAEDPERRQEFIAEVIANCWVAFVRLSQLRREFQDSWEEFQGEPALA